MIFKIPKQLLQVKGTRLKFTCARIQRVTNVVLALRMKSLFWKWLVWEAHTNNVAEHHRNNSIQLTANTKGQELNDE